MWSECTSKPKVDLPMKIMDQRCKVEVGRWNKNANKTIQRIILYSRIQVFSSYIRLLDLTNACVYLLYITMNRGTKTEQEILLDNGMSLHN